MDGGGVYQAMMKPENLPEGDFANYFCTYGYLFHQKEMLEDQQRMQAYYDAVFTNKSCFEGKVVLDVGTGSGILSIWAAQAGAKKVYAVEATHMATHARTLIQANGLSDVIEVFQCTAEELQLPEKVDIVISEWMGYFLLRESMLDSVIKARDKWMKPGGSMYPSHARMLLAPMRGNSGRKKHGELQEAREGWEEFVQTTQANFGVDMSSLTNAFTREQTQYYLETSAWSDISPSQILGPPAVLASFDLNTVTLEDIQRPKANWEMVLEDCSADTAVDAFLGWFDVDFRGSDANPAPSPVTLDTAPDEAGSTHWGQQAFYLHPPQAALAGDVLRGTFEMVRKSENHRLMTVHMSFQHGRAAPDGSVQLAPSRLVHYSIE